MSRIIIHTDLHNNEIHLLGDVSTLTSNRYALRYIKDFLNPTFEQTRIIISINEEKPEVMLSNINNMLIKYGIEETHSESTKKIFTDFYEEERKFKEFSSEALKIRNNDCNSEDFKKFSDSLVENLKNRSLYPLQMLSAYHLAFSQNACNFSVPGSGKTSIVYGAFSYLKNLPDIDFKKVDKLLIVGPLSSFGPWELEYKECFGKKPQVKRLTSNLSLEYKSHYLRFKKTELLTLVSYASLVTLKEDIVYFLKHNRVMMVLDEAHKAKNTTGGVIASAVLTVAKYCKSRVVLTGTPAPNGYEDLYNIFKFIWPSKNVIGFHLNQLKNMSEHRNEQQTDVLTQNISPFFIRIKKSDLDIPTVIEHKRVIPMGRVQQDIYDFIEKRFVNPFIQGEYADFISMFKSEIVKAQMVRLMQAATNPSMLKKLLFDSSELPMADISKAAFSPIHDSDVVTKILKYSDNEIPSKYIAARKLVEEIIANDGKVVIWANFIHTINNLKSYLGENGIISQELYGDIPVESGEISSDDEDNDFVLTREKIVNEFQKEDCPYKVIIANPFAVAESISLHKACHNAIYIERSFNAAHFVQSKDRIHRYGLKPTDKTSYYYLVSENSIDETVHERLKKKEFRMMEIMESSPIPLFDNVTLDFGDDDIKALIKDYVRRTKKV